MLKAVFSKNNLTQFQSNLIQILNLMKPVSVEIGNHLDDYTAKVTLEYDGPYDEKTIHTIREGCNLGEAFCSTCEVYVYDIDDNDNLTDCHMFCKPNYYEYTEYYDRIGIEIRFDELHAGPNIDQKCKEIEILRYYAMSLRKLMKEAFDENSKEEKKMDFWMKLRDFVVDNEGEYILKNCKEGDSWSKIITNEMEIQSVTPSGLTISLVDEQDQIILVSLPNDDTIEISAKECPMAETFLGNRTVLYERTCIKKWNNVLSPGHFYLTFDDDGQIGDVVFLRRLEDNFLEWEEFSRVKNYDSYHTDSRIVQLSMGSLTNRKFIPLYGFCDHVDNGGDGNGNE